MVNWTDEQKEAIYESERNILVAAAAGSGKTAVLVERIIQKLLNESNPVDIDSLLVVTFTNAAAREMRNRVGIGLEKALLENPESLHLKKQLALLERASISTLHSFCMEVIREYAYLLDIDPAFRIANDMEVDLIKQDVLDELFEEWYGQEEAAERDAFFAVVDRFSSDRSDVEVEALILNLFTFAMQNPWPEVWLDSLAAVYNIPEDWQEGDLQFLQSLKAEVQAEFSGIRAEMERALAIAEESDGPDQYIDNIKEDLAGLDEAEQLQDNWADLQQYMVSFKFGHLSRKKMDCHEDMKEAVKKIRDSYKKLWTDMKDRWFNRSLEYHIKDMRVLYPVVEKLTQLVKTFSARYTERKKEQALVDFADLEHYCLQILLDEKADENHLIPSSVAHYFQDKFSEVLVDEYQDTNLVQETIIQLVSQMDGPGNTFMVGDVKQSVYRFRHAEPSLFIEKYKRFAKEDNPGLRIDLARNFRSRKEILMGANYIFRQVLDEELGELAYDDDAALIYGNKSYDDVPFGNASTELIMIDRDDEVETVTGDEEENAGESFLDLEKAQLEARVYAKKIKQWISKESSEQALKVVDKQTGEQRPIQYRDIVILLRSMTWAPTIIEELKQQGIPVYAEIATGYFEAIEIKVMISFLKVIDNPRQDIPLAAVLRSPIVGLTENELANVRLALPKDDYFDALKMYEKENTSDTAIKVKNFLILLEEFRIASREGALSKLIWDIYRETGYYDFVGGMPGGRQRQANLRALYDRARNYEETSFRGLFRFLRFIERMEERGDDLGAARALSEQEDVVRMMTIHKSKGLEFPVVILGGLNHQFNFSDLSGKYLLDKDAGFATKFIDPIKRVSYTTLYYEAIKQKKLKEQLAEEMRVLYVAVTRAKEKLIMVGNVNKVDSTLKNWQRILETDDWVMPTHFRKKAKTYLDWVGPSLVRHQMGDVLRDDELPSHIPSDISEDPSKWDISIVHASELANLDNEAARDEEKLAHYIKRWEQVPVSDEQQSEWVTTRLEFHYPHLEATITRAKQSVTEIKRQKELQDDYADQAFIKEYKPPIIKRPNFLQKVKKLTAAEIGTAMHTVMQHMPLQKKWTLDGIAEEVEKLVSQEMLTTDEADAIDFAAVKGFFDTPFASYMVEQEVIYREVPFSLTLRAEEIYNDFQGDGKEEVLIQGVIDCLVPKDDGWVILDYKTDAIHGDVTVEKEQELIKRYEIQLKLYKQAVERILKQPVKEAQLYFFSKQLLLQVPLDDE